MMWLLMGLNGILGYFICVMFINLFSNNLFWKDWSGLIGFILFFIGSFLIAKLMSSKFGFKLLSIVVSARKMSNREQEKIKHALYYVQSKTKEKFDFQIDDLRLYTVDDPMINAFAMGSNILAINLGAIENLNDDELTGLIAHEFGHFYHKDSQKQAINFGLLLSTEFILWISSLMFVISNCFSNEDKNGKKEENILYLILLIPMIIALFFKFFGSIGIFIYNFVYKFSSRKQEYRANKFACKLGFGSGFLSVLEKLKSYDFKDNSFSSRIQQTHPDITLRIDKIDKYLAAG